MKNPFESSCRRRASRGLWLHLPESSQEFVSNEGTSGTSFLLSINSNPRWVCAIYVWSFAISVGRDRKIDIYSVSIKENTWALGIIWVLEIPFQLFLQFLHPSKVVHPICICLHCYYQQKKRKEKKNDGFPHIRYSLLWISSEIWMIEKGVCTFSLQRCGCPRPRLVNKNFNVLIGFSTSHYFYNLYIKQCWCIKCLLFADCESLCCQDRPDDLHHVQRPQPSWQDDLVINEQKTVLTITRREKTDQNNQ